MLNKYHKNYKRNISIITNTGKFILAVSFLSMPFLIGFTLGFTVI